VTALPPPVRLAPQGWAPHLADRLRHALARVSDGQLGLLRTVIQEGTYGWLLATAEGHVATCEGASVSLLAELVGTDERSGVWREWVHVPDPERFDPVVFAAQMGNRALLTRSPLVTDSGSRDVIIHGEVAAHLLAALAPLFLAIPSHPDRLPRLLDREGRLAASALSLVDDRTSPVAPLVGPCDGEGLPARRTVLLETGIPRHRLASYRDALLCGESPRGGAVRLSYRDYPSSGIANLQAETDDPAAPARMLADTDRALYLLRPLAPVQVDLAHDAYRLVASGVWLAAGKVRGFQPVVELRGALGLLLRRIEAVGADLAWYQTEAGFIGAPTLLARRQPVVG
jgi:PmbA protein